ncbi:hypothetical protein OC846_001840 [Tilletia horrida]|uniref:Major facilitator superfamily (MFS) profile domain-containing protein n=1 Tax=Tilletia horrida TaxID=155126 RepID=A0AAN6GS56_9BASI|nr:hypothetical protein OC845_001570 [Tilletia horrida]KAK0555159.1 hypothetical protein OC846_001840 [Tilletia horrida]
MPELAFQSAILPPVSVDPRDLSDDDELETAVNGSGASRATTSGNRAQQQQAGASNVVNQDRRSSSHEGQLDAIRAQIKYLIGRSYSPFFNKLGTLKEAMFGGEAYQESGVLFKEIAIFGSFLVLGWADASTGALLPSIEAHYHVNFVVVSMLFICNLVGCYLSAFVVPWLQDRFGLGASYACLAAFAVAPFATFIPLPPFPVFAFMYLLIGMSNAGSDSLGNTFMTTRPRSDIRLGILHFVYGIGALLAPLAAVPFNSGKTPSFSYFYAIPLGLAVLNTLFLSWSLGLKNTEKPARTVSDAIELSTFSRRTAAAVEALPHLTIASPPAAGPAIPVVNSTSSADIVAHVPTYASTSSKLRAVLTQRNVHLLALFTLLYVGTEVSIGGWTSTFLLKSRDGSVSSEAANYLVSGFWAGIAAGRVLLIPVTSALGDEMAVIVYIAAALGLQLIVWLVPHVIADGVALAIMGILVEVAARKIRPRALHTTALSWLISFGAAGSALLPFIVGLSAQAHGIGILAPLLVGLLVAQVLVWIVIVGKPSKARSRAEAARLD